MGNIIAIAIILLIVGCCIFSIIKDKKSGKTSCGCGCESCAMSGKCHPAKQ
ncbi:MAG: FeoB-associated Cys-rich membrane protein [Lachnospiraceae bacterium]|nr:FeoB-associated Cys-rich membrane protein [Lachnospiraceae bacterium]